MTNTIPAPAFSDCLFTTELAALDAGAEAVDEKQLRELHIRLRSTVTQPG